MCASTQRGKTKNLLCYAQRKKPTERARANELDTHYILWLLGCYRVRKIPHTNSLKQLDTHPTRYPEKPDKQQLRCYAIACPVFRARSPPYVTATFAGCLQALHTISRATLASKVAGQAGKANRGALYRAYILRIYAYTVIFFKKVLTPYTGYDIL